MAKRDRETTAANLAKDLAGSGEDDTDEEDELTWGTVIHACTPGNEEVDFPGNTWLTWCCSNKCWSNEDPCKFVWCPNCKGSVLMKFQKKLGIDASDEGGDRRRSSRGGDDVNKYRGKCGGHTYADLLKSVPFTDESCQFDKMLKRYGKSKVGNIPRSCWGCGKLL